MKHVFILIFVIVISPVWGENNLFEKKIFIYKNDTLPYRILYPENYDKTKSYPLVLFLHGSGESGNDNEKQLINGGSVFSNQKNRIAFPAIVIFPQCPGDGSWAPYDESSGKIVYFNNAPPTKPMQMVILLMHQLKKTESVDTHRMYVTGLSMGGMGVLDLVCRHPHMFAAAAPICGGIVIERLKSVKKMSIRIYHGAIDPVVPVEDARSVYHELIRLGSEKVEYFEFPGVGHGSWNSAFAQPDFMSWFFSKRKK